MHKGPAPSNKDHDSSGGFGFVKEMIAGSAATVVGTTIEQVIWYPIDTIGTQSQLNHMKALPWLREYRQKHGTWATYRMLNNGLVVTGPKKLFQRGYKYMGQDRIKQWITKDFGPTIENYVGSYSNVAINSAAGSLIGTGEVIFIQPWDRLQKEFQAKQIPFSFAECKKVIKKLGLKGLYKAGVLTAGRNYVGSGFHFGIPPLINKLANNQHQQNLPIDFSAKFVGSFVGLLVAQPFDVIKVNMQIHGLTFSEAFTKISVKQMLTSGLGPRMLLSLKIATGYFGVDFFMRFFKQKASIETSNKQSKPQESATEELAKIFNNLQINKPPNENGEILNNSSKPLLRQFPPSRSETPTISANPTLPEDVNIVKTGQRPK